MSQPGSKGGRDSGPLARRLVPYAATVEASRMNLLGQALLIKAFRRFYIC